MTLAKRYTSNSHCVFNLGYHIVFCPKYRRKVLVNGVDERLKILLQQKADELGITLETWKSCPIMSISLSEASLHMPSIL